MDDEKMQAAMQIILHAGDARTKCKAALDAIAVTDFVLAKTNMEAAQTDIRKAHKIQTDAIQSECSGDSNEYSVLFAHAQDTLMTINSEIIITKQMIKIFESYEKRIAALEK
jgi:PTS system cellobiose-specific IIA component